MNCQGNNNGNGSGSAYSGANLAAYASAEAARVIATRVQSAPLMQNAQYVGVPTVQYNAPAGATIAAPACQCIKFPCDCGGKSPPHGTTCQVPPPSCAPPAKTQPPLGTYVPPHIYNGTMIIDGSANSMFNLQLDRPYICEPCPADFILPTIILVDKYLRPVGYSPTLVNERGIATRWTVANPRTYVEGAANTLWAHSFNLWASFNNTSATGQSASMLKGTKLSSPLVSSHLHTLTYNALVGGFWMKFTAGQDSQTAMDITIQIEGITSWFGTTVLDRTFALSIPEEIVRDGYLLALHPYKEADIDGRGQTMWAGPSLLPAPATYNANDVEPNVSTQVTLINPGSVAAMRAAQVLRYYSPIHATFAEAI